MNFPKVQNLQFDKIMSDQGFKKFLRRLCFDHVSARRTRSRDKLEPISDAFAIGKQYFTGLGLTVHEQFMAFGGCRRIHVFRPSKPSAHGESPPAQSRSPFLCSFDSTVGIARQSALVQIFHSLQF